jgi:integrase
MANIQKRPDGRWRARYRDDTGREHAKHFQRKVDAQGWLDQVTAAVVTGQYVDPKAGRITFTAYYEQWRERQIWVPGTRRAMDLAAGSVTFGTVPMRSVRQSHVEHWVKDMVGRDLAATTVHTRASNVRTVLRGAVVDRVISSDPGERVRLPRQPRSEHSMTIPTTQQVGKIIGVADDSFQAVVGLCAFAGLRVGEAAGVQVGDIDFLRRVLTVSRQIQRENGGFEIRPPKYGSVREVNLAPTLVSMLATHVSQFRPGDNPARWLFTGQGEDPPHQNTVGHRWRKTLGRAGIGRLRQHDLRHFFASGLIAAGCDVVTVQKALGHSRATTTLNTYGHLWPTAEDRTRAASEEMLVDALGTASDDSADSLRTKGAS